MGSNGDKVRQYWITRGMGVLGKGYWNGDQFGTEECARSYSEEDLPEFIDGRWGLVRAGDDPARWVYRGTCWRLEKFFVVAVS